jgi:DNA-binding response OmpR family regulator
MNRILLIEDDPVIREEVADTLRFFDYAVSQAGSGEEGCRLALATPVDLVVLDIMLPGVDGFAVCRKLKERKPGLPILILSAKGQESDRLLGFELGADDYLTKPFSLKELVARVKALLKRSPAAGHAPATMAIGAAVVDFERYQVVRDGQAHELSAKECRILQLLARHSGQAIGRDRILDEVWGESYNPTPRTIDNFIRKLRTKIEDDPDRPHHLLTVHGVGYKLEP